MQTHHHFVCGALLALQVDLHVIINFYYFFSKDGRGFGSHSDNFDVDSIFCFLHSEETCFDSECWHIMHTHKTHNIILSLTHWISCDGKQQELYI